ncbi:lymphocyte antigen 6E-like [Rhineura floridana]|uniref:lymphocyte antigen 6E-like n=1 Tax=Rhineura floridana TaxID=261503 RepID=UPI002AC834ED|nr:lymphocyte antigen 6E-like [Rhineura floridana]
MKTFTVVLLVVAAFCVERASSLHCYKCENAKSHAECTNTVKCSDMDRFCVAVNNQGPGDNFSINKWCAPQCPTNFEIKGGKLGYSAQCCETNYCNKGAAGNVKASYVIMIMATLASFAYILQAGL